TEERAPPFRQELLCELLVVGTQGEPDLGRRIARLRERGEQLLVNDLAPAGRLDSHGHLGRGVQAVLEAGQIVERLVGETVGRALRDPFESNERAAERLPQVGDRRLVPLPVAATRRLADGVTPKPFSLEELVETVQRLAPA